MRNRKIVIVEDEGLLALQIENELLQNGHSVAAIYASGEEALKRIEAEKPDLVLMDIKLQGKLDGIDTAEQIQKKYDVPIIYMTAHSEEGTIERAKVTGPYGYLLKPVIAKELHIAVEIAIYKHKIDKEKEQLTNDLRNALDKVKLLSGMLPICASCKKIRNDQGYWEQVEVFIRDHSEAEFSHGICPECVKKLYPDYSDKILRKKDG
ncbi:MAG: response regulator [Nitrospirae bacterium]|nr:response regulator [Nitrospirota bacterium]